MSKPGDEELSPLSSIESPPRSGATQVLTPTPASRAASLAALPPPEPPPSGTQALPSARPPGPQVRPTGTQQLSAGTQQLSAGTQQLPSGTQQLPTGTQQLSAGAQSLTPPPTGTEVLGAARRTGSQASRAGTPPPLSGVQPPVAVAPQKPGTGTPPPTGTQALSTPLPTGTEVLPSGAATPRSSGARAVRVPPLPSGPPPAAPRGEAASTGGLVAGDRVRHYEIIRPLGHGGMGDVFLARDTKLGRRVAIKFLHTEDPALVERFVLEARATASCNHENIVTIHDADAYQGRPYMVLEYLQGHTLASLLADGKPLPPGRAVELMTPVLRALARAHGEGIVHRDLKPENVMLTDAGVLKVLDFGIAKVLGDARPEASPGALLRGAAGAAPSVHTEQGLVIGTMLYMSPEQWVGEGIDHRSDLWAVGIMLFRMLSGRHPLPGLDQQKLARTVVSATPMPSLREAPGVPLRLAEAVDACLAKDAARRPASAEALLELLAPFLPGRATRPLARDESPYAGLGAFQESNADLFFGRTHEVASLVHRLRDEPLVAVVGPSGVGKSSFVRAGVVPALKRMGESWEALVVRPGRAPLAALASALSPANTTGKRSVADEAREEQDLQARLVAEPGHAGALLRAYARRHNRRVLLFVDQLEELFTLASDAAERQTFSACIAGVADDATAPVRVVVSVRSDFLDRVFEDARLAELRPGLCFLSTPSDEGLRDALALPAELAGYRFEQPAMVEELVHDLRSTDGALSLLQFAATQLWEARDVARKVLTRASYETIGGIAGALARYADRVLDGLAAGGRQAARELFLRLVTRERTRAVVSLDELREVVGGQVDALVEQLVQARLVVVQKSERGSTAELVHESLVHSWPTLRRWLDESGEDAQFLEQLRTGARQWDAGGRGRGLLWRGEPAEEARRFDRRYRGQLPEVQRDFLDAVLSNHARAARRRRAVVVGVVASLLVVAAGSLAALVVIRQAQQEAVRQAEIAHTAERAARDRAEALARKERERAEAAQRAESFGAELQVRNVELQGALEKAEAARQEATRNQELAEANAVQARREQLRADASAQALAIQLRAEQDRVKRLKEQFGSPIAETLPR